MCTFVPPFKSPISLITGSDSDASDDGDTQSSSKSKKRRPLGGDEETLLDVSNEQDSDDADDMLSVQEDSDISEDIL